MLLDLMDQIIMDKPVILGGCEIKKIKKSTGWGKVFLNPSASGDDVIHTLSTAKSGSKPSVRPGGLVTCDCFTIKCTLCIPCVRQLDPF